ncbi:MAG TPA: GTP cyclohydrolase II, partial [Candidatus Dadabacteria bacterium]|nr:GTP cyclohydrolase II [Candidatus Dadabacteria bacterium]
GRGLICLSMDSQRANNLDLVPVNDNARGDLNSTAFTVSIDAKKNVTTGISAKDRSTTAMLVADDSSMPSDFNRPGHMFPLVARGGGTLVRAGHTEASVDIARLAGLQPCSVICEIMNDDGTMARLKDCKTFAKKHKINIATIADLISYRLKKESLVSQTASCELPTFFGNFRCLSYQSVIDGKTHIALVLGKIKSNKETLVRVHSECLTGDIFGSHRCDCGSQLSKSLEMIKSEGVGVLLYLRQEGRGIGIAHKIQAYSLQDQGLDTVEANEALGYKPDLREYGTGAQILRDVGLKKIKLLTNNPTKVVALEGFGLSITQIVPIEIEPGKYNIKYLETKKKKLGHNLTLVE